MTPNSKNVQNVGSSDFDDQVLQSSVPVLVDFTATWCGPCKALRRVLDQVAEEKLGQVRVVAVDIDAAPDIAARYGVRTVPTLVAFHRGEALARRVGLAPKEKVLELVQNAS